MNKSWVILALYDVLKQNGKISLEKCCAEYKISAPTFRRYLALLRSYFWEVYRCEIKYDLKTGEYAVKQNTV
ncbi:MAG: DeoR family transcriptional regulator [Clostridia bacterium]|nr:DeoR family transcriptional regulator [Clostridia bacterium]